MKIVGMRFWKNVNDYQNLRSDQFYALPICSTGELVMSPSGTAGLGREDLSFRSQMSVSTRSAYALTAGFSSLMRGACRLRDIARTLNQICANSDQVDLSVL